MQQDIPEDPDSQTKKMGDACRSGPGSFVVLSQIDVTSPAAHPREEYFPAELALASYEQCGNDCLASARAGWMIDE
jgi:hypothetical protein